ncbi:uncharacterized protein LOC127807495 isoform X2 [Diospyros lotus]|uniref:uncharacterized protein LOC127807495 isoform X2 n=2 Tax=Diospyros lotus TaxID=55363 RepID=UPI002253D6BE|nr:uncharacterized protein LOC127807495 isoform X2 [Diospyros lotus]
MSSDANLFVEWEEHIISPEKGNRVVHYFLKNVSGDSVLAVIGTEKSIRHMIYVVADEYLQAYGSDGFINTNTKWRARREVVDWLTLMVSKHHPPIDIANVQANDSSQALISQEDPMADVSVCQINLPDTMVARRLKVQNSDIVWSGVAWICSKQLKHYPAFCRKETTIAVHSFVFVMAEESSRYIGYLEDLYEDKKGQKKVKVRWFHHNQEVKGTIVQLNPHPREVFITPHVQVISAECIDGPAIVLTPKHYEKCLATAPHALSAGIHMCFRQFKSNNVKPFSVSKLRGYSNQAILSTLGFPLVSKNRIKNRKSNGQDEAFIHDGHAEQVAKRNRSCRQKPSINGNQISKNEPTYKKLKIKLSNRELGSFNLVGPEPSSHGYLKVGEKIELLSQDSGIRGCWFRCKIVQASQKCLKVQYVDVLDADGSANLEEWVPAFRVAAPDKLGMRCPGRPTVRPWPSEDLSDFSLEVGASVDAWWKDGWWEGVIMGVNISGNDNLQVYFSGEDRFLTLQRKNIRTSRDWVGKKWVDIKTKPDIKKLPRCSRLEEASEGCPFLPSDCIAPKTKVDPVKEVKGGVSSLITITDGENMERVDLGDRTCVQNEDNVDRRW